ncbi:MAG: ParB N-terminal domain-containing protein, partial [Bacteroidales bacterium]|nr:ParB N-terminal domain-containing protein [Bacteroidales bacterium]
MSLQRDTKNYYFIIRGEIEMAVKKGLGRGLDSLMNENATDDNLTAELRLSEIEPNKDQPRIHFDEEALQELAESIATHGLLQPIVV